MSLPKINETPNQLFRMRHAATEYKLLKTAVQLKIFDYLDEPKTFEQVSDKIGSHPRNTMFFLNALTACRLIEKKDGFYKNLPVAQTFLVQKGLAYLGNVFEFQDKMLESMLADLPGLIIDGPEEKNRESVGSEKRWTALAEILADNARSGAAQQAAELVSEIPEFPGFKKMLDLGGGPGIFCMAMVDKHLSMKGVVFDREPVTKIASEYISQAGMKNRIDVLSGDFTKDSIGSGYDFIWASSTLNFAGDQLDLVIKKIYDALNPNGVFISFAEGVTNEGTSPVSYVIGTIAGFLTSTMSPLQQGVVADAMVNAGFKSVRSRTIHTCSAWENMDIDIARK